MSLNRLILLVFLFGVVGGVLGQNGHLNKAELVAFMSKFKAQNYPFEYDSMAYNFGKKTALIPKEYQYVLNEHKRNSLPEESFLAMYKFQQNDTSQLMVYMHCQYGSTQSFDTIYAVIVSVQGRLISKQCIGHFIRDIGGIGFISSKTKLRFYPEGLESVETQYSLDWVGKVVVRDRLLTAYSNDYIDKFLQNTYRYYWHNSSWIKALKSSHSSFKSAFKYE